MPTIKSIIYEDLQVNLKILISKYETSKCEIDEFLKNPRFSE